ncbi:MAG TPA: hypothetical protein VGI39_40450 [Polyangiaceae bacterium]|jgi:hypothetical protein
MPTFREYVPGSIWLAPYSVRLGGAAFEARTAILRCGDGGLVVHSPGPLDDGVRDEIAALGPVRAILAPGNFHHLHVVGCQRAFPRAETWICPGVERKQPALRYDRVVGDEPPGSLAGELDQVFVRGGRVMCEVAILHRPSRTLLLVDVLENFTDATPGVNWLVRASFKAFGMWNDPTPAPEYRFAWKDRGAARESLERILAWDFDRIVISHGDLVDRDAKGVARRAWRRLLGPK